MDNVILNGGVEMPIAGLGTAFLPLDQLPEVIWTAYEVGYRKFDTAWSYGNESVLGKAIHDADIKRDSIFITSKIHAKELYFFADRRFYFPKKSLKRAIDAHLKLINQDYIDLLLIHWPFRQYLELWEELCEIHERDKSRIRAVGVSSWLPAHMQNAIDKIGVIPSVNQFEINPYLTNEDLVLECKKMNVHPESYSSFGSQNSSKILNDTTILKISEKYNKSTSQVILRWLVQRGISVVPRSTSRKHLIENLNIFDFQLTEDELKEITGLNRNEYSRFDPRYTISWV